MTISDKLRALTEREINSTIERLAALLLRSRYGNPRVDTVVAWAAESGLVYMTPDWVLATARARPGLFVLNENEKGAWLRLTVAGQRAGAAYQDPQCVTCRGSAPPPGMPWTSSTGETYAPQPVCDECRVSDEQWRRLKDGPEEYR
jgi:hypothetical protein